MAPRSEGHPPSDTDEAPLRGLPANRYDAFMAYSHLVDTTSAIYLRLGLQHLVTPAWQARPPLRVYRFLAREQRPQTRRLLPEICDAIDGSAWFILLASPPSARSIYVEDEIDRWLTYKPAGHIIIVRTSGRCTWDPSRSDFDFDFERSSAIHPRLRGAFQQRPRIFDMTWAGTTRGRLCLDDRYFELLADIAAPILGIPRSEVVANWPLKGWPPSGPAAQ
jgi:hypothetical protein